MDLKVLLLVDFHSFALRNTSYTICHCHWSLDLETSAAVCALSDFWQGRCELGFRNVHYYCMHEYSTLSD